MVLNIHIYISPNNNMVHHLNAIFSRKGHFFFDVDALGQRDALVMENVRAIVGGSHLDIPVTRWGSDVNVGL